MTNPLSKEDVSKKYSPEWFYEEAQNSDCLLFEQKAEQLRNNFINRFGIEQLKALSGKDLLTSLFYNDEGNKTNLCYMLEMDRDIRETFGGISADPHISSDYFFIKRPRNGRAAHH